MSIREEVLGNSHLETAASYYIIGNFNYEHIEFDKALEYCTKAFDNYQSETGVDSVDTLSIIEKIENAKRIMNDKDIYFDEGSEKKGFWSRLFRKK